MHFALTTGPSPKGRGGQFSKVRCQSSITVTSYAQDCNLGAFPVPLDYDRVVPMLWSVERRVAMRFVLGAVLLAVTFIPGGRLAAAVSDGIISEPAAGQHGLARPWFTQVEMDAARRHICDITLYEGMLYLRPIGRRLPPSTPRRAMALVEGSRTAGLPRHDPGGDRDLLATINGSGFMCQPLYRRIAVPNKVAGSPNGSPSLSDDLVFVPTAAGWCWPIAWSHRAIRPATWGSATKT